jgi:hypothetical protein
LTELALREGRAALTASAIGIVLNKKKKKKMANVR